jgi:amyloid beta precursor protein binding protein 1
MLDTRSLAQEIAQVDLSGVDIEDEDSQQSPLIWYFMLRAVAAFVSTFHRYPGSERKDDDDGEGDDETSKQDRAWLVDKARQLATAGTSNDGETGRQVASWISDAHALEMTRSCEVELHNVAALMGGVASQEAVKLITHQFVPLEHTYIFNGICGLAATYNL